MSSSDRPPGPVDVTILLERVAAGDRQSTDRLLEAVYDQLRKIAQQRMQDEKPGHTLQATALVHEAYLRLVRNRELKWSSRAQFYVAAARAMQQALTALGEGQHPETLLSFEELRKLVGFPEYDREQARYKSED